MNPSSSLLHNDSDVATNFWPQFSRVNDGSGTARLSPRVAANLYELFVHELALLVSGACQTDRLARLLFASLAPEQLPLRQLVLGIAQSARGCVAELPAALTQVGLRLPYAHDVVVDVLLRPINPGRPGPMRVEPRSVVGVRVIGAFTHVALHFETAATRAAEDALLLGSDLLYHALRRWVAKWSAYLHDLRLREQSFRAQAYVAGLNTRPCWQTA